MVSQEPNKRGFSFDEARREAPYVGQPGQTRREPRHFSCSCGTVFSFSAVLAVNVETHRELAEAAVAGNLNKGLCPVCGSPVDVVVAYTLHHPQEERFVLVVPEVMRHREFDLRADLLREVGKAAEVPVPAYVREHQVVFGTDGLRRALSGPASHVALRDELVAQKADIDERQKALTESERLLAVRDGQLTEKERAIEQQEESVTIREERLNDRGEQITRSEDDLRQREVEQQARREALETRLRMVEQRELALAERERQAAVLSQAPSQPAPAPHPSSPAPHPSSPAPHPSSPAPHPSSPTPAAAPSGEWEAPPPGGSQETVVAPPPKEYLSMAHPPGLGAPETKIAEETQRSTSLTGGGAESLLTDEDIEDAEELSPEDILEEADEITPEDIIDGQDVMETHPGASKVRGLPTPAPLVAPPEAGLPHKPSEPPPLTPPAAEPRVAAAEPTPEPEPEPEPPAKLMPEPPPHWVRGGDLTLHMLSGDEVHLFARMPSTEAVDQIQPEKSDLWIQLHVMEEYPLICLTLVVDRDDDNSEALHWFLDIEEDEDRALLQLLRRRFRARCLLYDKTAAALIDEVTLEPPREVNVANIVDRATQELGNIKPADLNPAGARVRFRGDWDRLGKKRHPFVEDAYAEIRSPAEAKLALGILSYWSEQENHDYLVLVKSVPVDLLDTITRRILDGAIRHGLWLPRPLKERAVALGLSADLPSLVARLVDSFAALGTEPPDLELAQAGENWQRLLRDADELDVPIRRETLRLAEDVIEKASQSDDGDESDEDTSDIGPLEEQPDDGLIKLLDRRSVRAQAALELASRSHEEHLDALFRAARKLNRQHLSQLVPLLLKFGESAGDYFVEGLSSRKSFMRQACALALGELKLRRAVVPLLHQMLAEKTSVWSEIARALGRYGPAAVKPLQRYLKDPRGKEERLVLAMAFLASGGAAKQVEAVRASTSDEAIAALAEKALEKRDVARSIGQKIEGDKPLDENEPMLKFSRRLHRAFAGEQVDEEEPLEELDDEDIVELEEEE